MKTSEYKKLIEKATEVKGRRRYRYISTVEIDKIRELDKKRSLNGKPIRVYSSDGFVPNSYRGTSMIDYIERWYDDDGKKHFSIGQTSANRSYGDGPLVTVNHRAYE